jgi:hypothetical protein
MNSSFLRLSGGRIARAVARRWLARIPEYNAGWSALRSELDLWRHRRARFWWRDDDAISDTAALQRLLALRRTYQIPLAIAVIPAKAEPGLRQALQDQPGVCVLAHGWNHTDHGLPGFPSGELTAERQSAEVVYELSRGRAKLEEMFPRQFMPVLVPPYNHLAMKLVGAVKNAGFSSVSVDGDFTGLPIRSYNIHLDVIDWHRMRAARSAEIARSATIALKLRRFGLVDPDTPIGLMTHHLVHDAQVWEVTTAVLECLIQHPNATFPEMNGIFH